MPPLENYANIRCKQITKNYIQWCADRDGDTLVDALENIITDAKARDPLWLKDHPRPAPAIAVEAVDADAAPSPEPPEAEAAAAAVPMVPEADLDAAVALADETENELRLQLERLGAAVLAFAHPLGVARNLAPLEALHAARRALRGQQERDRNEMEQAQQEIADRDRALAELNPAELAEARRRIEELKREVGAATRKALRHESLVYELAAFLAYTGCSKAEEQAD